MRTLVILLLLANLSLFAYTRLDSAGGEGVRLKEQVRPEKIKILSPQEVAALGPASAASLADVCLEWGPFGDADRVRALAELDSLGLSKLVSQKRVETNTAWWVYVPPLPTKAAADRRASELKAAGHRDAFVVDGGPQRNAISLATFRTEEAATAYAAELAQQGVTGAKAGPRPQVVVQTLVVVRDPQQPLLARLREIAPSYPGAEAKIGACGPAS